MRLHRRPASRRLHPSPSLTVSRPCAAAEASAPEAGTFRRAISRTGACVAGPAFVAILALLAALSAAPGAGADTVTWSGGGGNSNWSNPDNWDGGQVPGGSDDVVIPEGTPSCTIDTPANVGSLTNEGSIGTSGNATISATNSIANHGTIDADGDVGLRSEFGDITNTGQITGGSVGISGGVVTNDGNIRADGTGLPWDHSALAIEGHTSFTNYGDIHSCAVADDGHGAGIHIKSHGTFDNHSNISTADGEGSANGGDVALVCEKGIHNHPNGFVYAGSAGPSGSRAGELLYLGKVVKVCGRTKSGSSDDRGGRGSRMLGQITILAVGAEIEMGTSERALEGAGIHVRAHDISVHDLTRFGALYSYQAPIDFYAGPGGAIDFSGTHYEGAVFAWQDGIGLHTAELIEPVEGIAHVIEPDPTVGPVDPSWVQGHLFMPSQMHAAGTVDSFEVKVRSFATAEHVFEIEISSALGWVTAETNSFDLPAFAADSFMVAFAIPAGTPAGTEDEVTATLTIAPGYEETFETVIFARSGGDQGVGDSPRRFRPGLVVAPAPFTGSCQIFARDAAHGLDEIRVHDVTGRLVWSSSAASRAGAAGSGRASTAGTIRWRPAATLPGGLYLVTARAGAAWLRGEALYLR